MKFMHLALLAAPASAVLGNWTLVKLTDAAAQKGAVCLDGSPSAYYIRPPLTPSGRNQWLIFHEGGGWCNGDQNCFQRSQSDLGSSKAYPAAMSREEASDLYDALPGFTVVYAKYCDGSSLTGDRDEPVVVGGNTSQTIFYRGRRVLDALLDDLLGSKGLAAADALLYSGCSAGALTAYSHVDYVAARVPATTTTVGMGDAMFSLQWRDFAQRNTSDPSTSYYSG
jgi:O-palmitoleoyl-L-serine hydrolase